MRHGLTDEERAEAEEEHGKLLAIGCDKKESISARIVVVTHRLWEEEVQREQQGAVRYHTSHDPEGAEKKRRSVIFVDEHPELVAVNRADTGRLRQTAGLDRKGEEPEELGH